MTRHAHDPHTSRLARLRSERYTKPDDISYRPSSESLQDFGYDYDLAGNIVSIRTYRRAAAFAIIPKQQRQSILRWRNCWLPAMRSTAASI